MIYGCGVGPLRSAKASAAVAEMLRTADVVTLRDARAVHNAVSLGISPNRIMQTADPALGLRRATGARPASIGSAINVGVALRRVPKSYLATTGKDERDRVEQSLLESLTLTLRPLLDQAATVVTLIPMQLHPSDDDRLLLGELRDRLGRARGIRLIDAYESPEALLREFEALDFLIGMRFHSVVFGMLTHIPLVSIDYDASGGKVTGVMQAMGLEEFVINICDFTPQGLRQRLERGLAQRESLRQHLAERMRAIRQRESQNGEKLRELLALAWSARAQAATCDTIGVPA
jgi:polysaccharide pyruvyl transferase WcaK-like protein